MALREQSPLIIRNVTMQGVWSVSASDIISVSKVHPILMPPEGSGLQAYTTIRANIAVRDLSDFINRFFREQQDIKNDISKSD